MNQMYCHECNQIVEAEVIEISPERSYGHGNYIQAEYEERCPICNGDELSDATKCKACGEYWNDDDVIDGVCPVCRAEAAELKAKHQVRCHKCDRTIDETMYFGDHCLLCKFDVIINDINNITAAMRAAKEI